jgi:hypothetical protein
VAALPHAPAIVVICDNDQIHHAAARDVLAVQPDVHLWYGARWSSHDNPTERDWAALKHCIANTAVSWPAAGDMSTRSFIAAHPGQPLGPDQLTTELLERGLARRLDHRSDRGRLAPASPTPVD